MICMKISIYRNYHKYTQNTAQAYPDDVDPNSKSTLYRLPVKMETGVNTTHLLVQPHQNYY